MSRNTVGARFRIGAKAAGVAAVAGVTALSVTGGGLSAPAHAAAAQRYVLTVGPAEAQRYLGINDDGDIIGVGQEAGAQNGQGFVVEHGTNTLAFLATPSDPGNHEQYTTPRAVNRSGVVVGDLLFTDPLKGHNRPIRWPAPGPTGADLGVDADLRFSDVEATGISDNGQISGKTLDANNRTSAWTVKGTALTRLPALPGGQHARANAVNDDGLVVGGATLTDVFPAVQWRNGQIENLGTLPGGTYAEAKAVNSAGVAVGVSTTTTGKERGITHAVVFAKGTVTDLNVSATGIANASANAINDKGTIVGSDRSGGFVYENGVATDLDTLIPPNSGYHITTATGINENGAIVGVATKGFGGRTFGVLLTPAGR
ncbi:hypothetical protein [Actinomadura roseirufa]|uniref:hypothetical protein n=1 Tax=Actinomadura roseirufa TaxID=2094049 RepID=UPI0010411F53|nr:hypothetical protein [Actinomadura roseirufa]